MRKVAWRDDRPAERPARAPEGKAAQDAVSGNGERQVAWKDPPIDPNRKRAWKERARRRNTRTGSMLLRSIRTGSTLRRNPLAESMRPVRRNSHGPVIPERREGSTC